MWYFFKVAPLFLWGVFILVIIKIPYPQTISQANLVQLSSFFIPLFLALFFSFNLFFKNYIYSVFISSGLIFLLILKALDSLNLITGILVITIEYLLISYFRNQRGNRGKTGNRV